LKYNTLGPEAGLAISQALKTNTSLTQLNVWNNDLGMEIGRAMVEALKGNTSLTTLDFKSNGFDSSDEKAIIEYTDRNKHNIQCKNCELVNLMLLVV